MRERLATIINLLDSEDGVEEKQFEELMDELPDDVAERIMGRVDHGESVYDLDTICFWLWEADADDLRRAFGL